MPQLVGSTCAVCRERIPSELDAGFCQRCGNAVHNRCVRVAEPAPPDTCPACGGDLKAAAAARAHERRQRQAAVRRAEVLRAASSELPDFRRTYAWYQAGRFLLGGFIIFPLGFALLVGGETGAGIGAMFAGLGMFAIGGYLARRR